MPEHGGRLTAAAKRYGIPLEQWIDLSTGINPVGWPVPPIPAHPWLRLPEPDDTLEPVARQYYSTANLLPVAGSQQAIQALPLLRSTGRVGMLQPAYNEHAHAWKRAGHEVIAFSPEHIEEQIEQHIDTLDTLLLINPNNPTGTRYSLPQLLRWHARLQAKGGWLVVDEAFMDATNEASSLAPHSQQQGLIVLRSLGKFFGLAGVRVGFVLATPDLLRELDQQLGPWAIAHPSRWVATQALQDKHWQAQTRQRLAHDAQRLHRLLSGHGLEPDGGCELFQWLRHPQAGAIHHHLARQGIFTRLFDTPASLRFGLPTQESQWQRLDTALAQLQNSQGKNLDT